MKYYEEEARKRQLEGLKQGDQSPVAANLQQREEKGGAAQHVAEVVGVSPRSIYQAKSLQEAAPELLDEVKTGKLTPSSLN